MKVKQYSQVQICHEVIEPGAGLRTSITQLSPLFSTCMLYTLLKQADSVSWVIFQHLDGD